MEKKFFTVREANETVRKITPVMAKIQEYLLLIGREMEGIASRTGCSPSELSPAEILKLSPQLKRLFEKLDRAVSEVESHGCYFKGFDLGLVDFPALIQGKEVFLCWQYGEEEVMFWHSTDEGFLGRRPLKGRERRPLLH